MSDTITIKDDEAVIGMLPILFGFMPSESVIAILTQGERNRFGFRMRMDLIEEFGQREAEQINTYLNGQGGDAVVLVVVSAHVDRRNDAIDLLTSAIDLPHIAAITADNPIAPSAECLAAAEATGFALSLSREAIERAYEPVINEAAHLTRGNPDNALTAMREALSALTAEGVPSLTNQQVADMREGADVVEARDEMWAEMTRENAANLATVWRIVAVQTDTANAYALCAFAHWLVGNGTKALIAIDHAQRIEPDHSMVALVLQVLTIAMDPKEWKGIK